jgi:hypothetical protein
VKGDRSFCLTLGRKQRLGDRQLKKSRKKTPMTEESKPRSAHFVSCNVGGRSISAGGSLKDIGNFPAATVGSAAIQERLLKTVRPVPKSSTLNPWLEDPGELAFFVVGNSSTLPAETHPSSSREKSNAVDPDIDIPLREQYVARPVYVSGNRTTLPEESSISDWMNILEKKFPYRTLADIRRWG